MSDNELAESNVSFGGSILNPKSPPNPALAVASPVEEENIISSEETEQASNLDDGGSIKNPSNPPSNPAN